MTQKTQIWQNKYEFYISSGTTITNTPTKTNGFAAPQPVPAPRRLTSQTSNGSETIVQSNSIPQNGNRSDEDDAQVIRCFDNS